VSHFVEERQLGLGWDLNSQNERPFYFSQPQGTDEEKRNSKAVCVSYLLVGDGGVAYEVEAVGDGLQILLHNDLRARQCTAEQACSKKK